MTTKKDIREWLERAPKGSTHMIVVCDTFNYEDYPVYLKEGQDARHEVSVRDEVNMQRVMEVYNLKKDLNSQLNSNDRVFEY